MSEIQPIRILHFSDFHLNKDHEKHAEKLLSNMLKAINENNKPIDLVIFSGDMIDQGGKSYGDISVAFERFKEIVIDKICDQLNISSERFVFTPGNHDIDGTKINPEADIGINQIHMTEEGKVHEYITTKSIFEREYPGRIQSVKDFEKLYYETLSNVQYTQGVLASNFVFSINGIKIGVSSLNTIWRCNYAKEKSEFNPIILGMDQISDSSDLIEECTVKFAVTHFDYDYLPEFEKDRVKDMIANNYDVLFTGHTHSTHVQSIMTSKGQKFLHLKSAGTLDCNRYSTHIDYQNAFQILTYYLEDHIEIIVYKQIDGQLFSQDMNFGSSGVYSEEIPKRKVNVTKTSNASIPQFELLTPILKKKFREIKKTHPSIKLMEENGHIVDENLYPRIKNSSYTLPDIILGIHKNTSQKHLIIEGEGGLGKTVALLNIFMRTDLIKDTIYINLNALNHNNIHPLSDYIIRMFNDNSLFDLVEKKANESWNEGPTLTLLLDGLNEIPQDYYDLVEKDIEYWSNHIGIQMIITSRPDSRNHELKRTGPFELLTLEALDKTTVVEYLKVVNSKIPEPDDDVWKIICNPLMLNLYYKGQSLIDNHDVKIGASEGVVIWNYLQYEINKSSDRIEIGDEIMTNKKTALLFVAPYIAYQMMMGQSNNVSGRKFALWGRLAITQVYRKLSDNNGVDLPDWEEIKYLLTEVFNLFHSTKNGNYELMHQEFRDVLAAIHLINVIKLHEENNGFPEEWKKPIGVFVMNHVADLINKDQADMIWTMNRKQPPCDTSTINVMDMQWRRLKGDFSNLDFSDLDLSNIELLPYRLPEGVKLKLPTVPQKMRNVKFSEDSFMLINNNGSGRISSLASTPNGKYIVSGSWNNIIQIWDTDNGHCKYCLKEHNRQVSTVAVNEKWCVSGSFNGTIIVWDCQNEWKFSDSRTISPIAGQQDSNIVNVVCLTKIDSNSGCCYCFSGWQDGKIRVWKIDRFGKLTDIGRKQIANNQILSMALSANEEYCVIRPNNKQIIIWEWKKEVDNLRIINSNSFSGLVCGLAVYGNVCVYSDIDKRLWWIDLQQAKSIEDIVSFNDENSRPESLIQSISFSPDGKFVATGSWDNTVRVWDMESKNCRHILNGHSRRVQAVVFSTDGRFIYSGSRDRTIKMWDSETGRCVRTMLASTHKWIHSIVPVLDEKSCILGCEDGCIRVWDMDKGVCKQVLDVKDGVADIVDAGRGNFIIGNNNKTIFKWQIGDDHMIELGTTSGYITCMSMEQGNLAVGLRNGNIEIWNSEGKYINNFHHGKSNQWVNVVRLKGKYCYSGSDKHIQIWDIENNQELPYSPLQGHKGRVMTLDVTPDGLYCVSGEGKGKEDDYSNNDYNDDINNAFRIWCPSNILLNVSIAGEMINRKMKRGYKASKNLLVVTDNEHVVLYTARKTKPPVLKYFKIQNHKPINEAKQITIGDVSALTANNRNECYFGTNKGYVGKWNYINNEFYQYPVLMDIDVIGVDFSLSIMDENLKKLLKCNGAIVDSNNTQKP